MGGDAEDVGRDLGDLRHASRTASPDGTPVQAAGEVSSRVRGARLEDRWPRPLVASAAVVRARRLLPSGPVSMDEQRLAAIAERYGARLVLQFGSSVSGKTHAGSDVDLAVLLEEPDISTQRYAELVHDLQELVDGVEVDLVILNRADPLLLKQVSDGCGRLYGSEREFQRFRLLAFKRYQDYRPYLELERRYVARALERDFPPS